MNLPNTKEEVRIWFCEGSNPTHDWEKLEPLVDKMWAYDRKMGIVDEGYSAIAKEIIDNKYLYKDWKFGWITDTGEFLTCKYASHEYLLQALDMDIRTIESKHNWIRVSFTLCAMDPPNEAQAKTLLRLMYEGIVMKSMVDKYLAQGWSI